MSKYKLALAQAQGSYGENTYLPLAVGCLYAHAHTFPEIREAWSDPVFLYKKEPIATAIGRLGQPLPDLLACSCYIWDFEWNKALAAACKQAKPTMTVLFGGVHVPDKPTAAWWDEHPYVDFLIHGEGEQPFADFLREYAGNRDWSHVAGLSTRELSTERKFAPLDSLRSPYLDGVFDKLLPLERRWQVLAETNRGC